MEQSEREQFRFFLKDNIRKLIDFSQTDQHQGIAAPPVQKPYPAGARIISLSPFSECKGIGSVDLLHAIAHRRSRRTYHEQPLSLDELALLLWTTQGMQQTTGHSTALRTVPSAGCRHALETYLCISHVSGLQQGIYRYLPVEHALLEISLDKTVSHQIVNATYHQSFTGNAPATFVWAAGPYRMEWRYGLAAHKVIALDAGHVCQNLYLSCEAIGCGCCAIAAYDQQRMDDLIQVDGKDEFTVYLASVGKVG